jgi:hypothetical protein
MLSGAIAYQVLQQENPQTIKKVRAVLEKHPSYAGKGLPFHVAMLVGSSITCRETGKSFVLEDIDQVYLAPVLRRRYGRLRIPQS